MCGIVGYIGYRDAYPILIKGLHRLEYRGYDSAGVALLAGDHKMNIYKSKGKVSNLEESAASKDISGHIENYSNLKTFLEGKGFTFKSSTDTEVLVQLIQFIQDEYGKDLEGAVVSALRRVTGAYAIAVVDKENPDKIVVARKSSPLVVGIGEDHKEFFLASDALPIVEYTKQMVYLNDGEVALLKVGQKMEIHTLDNEDVDPKIKEVDVNLDTLEKGGYEHFMLKEIYDQPRCISDCIRGRLLADGAQCYKPASRQAFACQPFHYRSLWHFMACWSDWQADDRAMGEDSR